MEARTFFHMHANLDSNTPASALSFFLPVDILKGPASEGKVITLGIVPYSSLLLTPSPTDTLLSLCSLHYTLHYIAAFFNNIFKTIRIYDKMDEKNDDSFQRNNAKCE